MADGPGAGMLTENVLRVLIVDDNQDAADSLSMLLQLWGYDCRVAYDGKMALEIASAYRPDCLILDIAMPRMDGYVLAVRVRQQAGLDKATLVALSAFSDEMHRQRIKEAGFDYHLVKPADLSELERILKMLNEVVRLAAQTEDLTRQNLALANETKSLLAEVKEDIKEIKEEVKELKEDLRETRGDPSAEKKAPDQ